MDKVRSSSAHGMSSRRLSGGGRTSMSPTKSKCFRVVKEESEGVEIQGQEHSRMENGGIMDSGISSIHSDLMMASVENGAD